MGSVSPDISMRSLNLSIYTLMLGLPWKYWLDFSHINTIIISFSGQNADTNSEMNMFQSINKHHLTTLHFLHDDMLSKGHCTSRFEKG
jgi:hypothetical protein